MSATRPKTLTGAQFSTYRIGGPIQEAYQPTGLDDAVATLQAIQQAGKPLTVLGWGSNSLIASAGISGATLITRKLDGVEQKTATGDNAGEVLFHFGAGVHLAKVSTVAQRLGLTGGEFFIGIPGTVGGAVRMNAGAMGQETATVVRHAFVYNLETAGLEIWDRPRLEFSYRHSAIDPRHHIILGAELAFTPGDPATIMAKMEGNVAFRKAHHPTEPNGGSVFRNPTPDMTVGKMLDALGAKSWVEGGVRISPLHANFIINTGNGTSLDVLRLMRRMQEAIYQHYGLWAHPENLFLGDATPEELALWEVLTRDSG